jgi:outer membrane protein OmpA-like peptidoglycan-associated protein
MRTILVASLLTALAAPAAAGPDFKSKSPRGTPMTASHSTRMILPEDDITFAHDSATLTESGLAQVEAAARWMRDYADVHLVVEGYADHLGSLAYNEALATRRAHAVRRELVRRGIPAQRIIVAVYGESLADPAGSPLDRRVVMYARRMPVVATR